MKNEGSLLSFRRIYYRGKLNSCNYTCSYCPFGKKSHLADTTQDEQAWNRFIAAIEQWKGEPLQLFIIPYGEAVNPAAVQAPVINIIGVKSEHKKDKDAEEEEWFEDEEEW
jgi:hypothetical protein